MGVAGFLIVFTAVIFFAPEFGGYFLEYNNFIPADPLKTPSHIAPVWYFTPFYSMLRATTDWMVHVFAALLGLAALLNLVKGRGGSGAKIGGVIGAAVFIALLYTFEAKFWGVVVMGAAVVILAFLPWLDHSPVKSIRYRPGWHKIVYGVFVLNFVMLGWLGIEPPSPVYEKMAQIGTLIYLGFFLLMPWWSQLGTFKPVPERVTYHPH
jgi:ubiquinol-cytochrome c reductase cytochrome b subunit